MKYSAFLVYLVLLPLLGACMQPPLVIGQTRASIAPEDVVIYYAEKPKCNFETIARLQASGGYYSLDSMLRAMRNDAAMLGASGLYVLQTQQLAIKEYLGTAKAIRCLPV